MFVLPILLVLVLLPVVLVVFVALATMQLEPQRAVRRPPDR